MTFRIRQDILTPLSENNCGAATSLQNIPLKNNLEFAPIGSSLIFDGGFLDFWSF